MTEKERNMENWRMGCVIVLPLPLLFPLGYIVNTTFMGLSHPRKYPCVLLCENESHTLEGLGQSECERTNDEQVHTCCLCTNCVRLQRKMVEDCVEDLGLWPRLQSDMPPPSSSLPTSTYSSFPSDSSCVTLDPLCPSSESS